MRRIEIVLPSEHAERLKKIIRVYMAGDPLRDEAHDEKPGFHRLWYMTENELEFITFLVGFLLDLRDPAVKSWVTDITLH